TGGWLGAGAYFARSIDGTIGKARTGGGAYIIAEIRMGKVYEVHRNLIHKKHTLFNRQVYDFVHRSKWQHDYDTCYMIHEHDDRDEFAIKDPERQIVKWVIVVERPFDYKVARYQLDTEFDSTKCGCI
ncbi:unnamed protein product, partial [Rotaria sp. Silwood2]